MAAPDYLEPILATGGPIASVAIMIRFASIAALRLLAGALAVLTKDNDRGQRCLELLRILRNKDSPPPSDRDYNSPQRGDGDSPPPP